MLQYLVYAALGVCCTWSQIMIMAWRDREGWCYYVFLGDGRVEDNKERDDRSWGKSFWETGPWEHFMWNWIYHPRYSRYESWSGGPNHRYEDFKTQSNTLYHRYHISTHVIYLVHIFIPYLSLSSTTLALFQNKTFSHPSLLLHAMIVR